MNVAELLPAVAAVVRGAFPKPWIVHDNPPTATGLPAVWPELFTGSGPVSRLAPCQFLIVAAVAPQTAAAESAREAEAIDRLDACKWPTVLTDARWSIVDVQIGGVDHTAVGYQLTLSRPVC